MLDIAHAGDDRPASTKYDREDVERLLAKWSALYGLTGYKLKLNVYSNPSDEDGAWVEAQPEYLTATLSFNLAQIDDLESTVRHEVAHILTWPLFHICRTLANTDAEREWIRYANELVAETLERIPAMQVHEEGDDEIGFEFEPDEE